MPAVELDEEELRRLRTLEGTMQSMLRHPKGGKLVEQALKMVDEKAPTPRLDAQAQQDELLAAERERIAKLEKRIEEDEAKREREKQLDALEGRRTKGLNQLRADGWTDEGIKGVEKIMEDQGILDPAIAAAYFEKLHPPALPVTPGGSGAWNFMELPSEGNDDLKRLVETRGESSSLVEKMARDALSEIRGQGRR